MFSFLYKSAARVTTHFHGLILPLLSLGHSHLAMSATYVVSYLKTNIQILQLMITNPSALNPHKKMIQAVT